MIYQDFWIIGLLLKLDETMRPNHGQLSYQLQSILSSANARWAPAVPSP